MNKIYSKNIRYILAFSIGIVVAGSFVAITNQWVHALLLGWDVTTLVLLFIIVTDMRGVTAKETARIAQRDDMNHSLMDVITLLASTASIGAVVFLLSSPSKSLTHIGFGLLSIVLSWAIVHMVYALRYAAMYYRNGEKGIDFGPESPRFSDFLYLAYTLGMTYQVSDTNFTNSAFRRVALGHVLLSFLFGVAILAITINFLASLSQ